MAYAPPLDRIRFAADLVGQGRLSETARFAEAGADTRAQILAEAGRLCAGVLAPLNAAGDRHPARLENGVVLASPGFAEAYRAIADGGWIALSADPAHGGMGLPESWAVMVQEMMAGACLSLSLCPLLTHGQIVALERHADPALAARVLPPLLSGEWTGTMCLSEPQAGSDVGALRCRAEPAGEGTWAITGEKIWISWGDHDMTGNILHLVLARLPDGPPGTRGISLFAVPKVLPGGDGGPGRPNAVRPVRVEEKLGLHGSPTCALLFEGALGWLVGEPHGGMAAMFTMMNNARLGVGVEGLAIAEAATQAAAAYAEGRVQGRTPDGTPGILGHADVRRMLMTMRARTEAARAICYDCALSLDLAAAADGEAERDAHAARAAALTPIAKAHGTETGIAVADLGIQVHGGMGYVEETGAAQLWRDVRVTAIYEGTNGIQALDLVGRKLVPDGGAALDALLAEAGATADAARAAGQGALADPLARAAARAREVTGWLLRADPLDRQAGASPYLRMMALVLGAHHLLRGGLAEPARLPLAAFFAGHVLPEALATAEAAVQGGAALYALPAEGFGA